MSSDPQAPILDGGMLVLLQGELNRQAAAIQEALKGLQSERGSSVLLESLRSAAGGVSAAARVARIPRLVDLGTVLAGLVPVNGEIGSAHLELIGRIATFCRRLAEEPYEKTLAEADLLRDEAGDRIAQTAPRVAPPVERERQYSSVSMSLVAVYQAEVETHGQTLVDNLLALEEQPDDPTPLVEMMRAAHSIKGAARIVSLEPAAELAHRMEDVFVAAIDGRRQLSATDVDTLLQCADTLAEISRVVGETETNAERDDLDAKVASLCDALAEDGGSKHRPSSDPAAPRGPVPPDPVPPEKIPVPPEVSNVFQSAQPVTLLPPLLPEVQALSTASLSLLGLFSAEVELHNKTLADGILRLEQGSDESLLEELMRAAHSIKGAARIALVEPAARLAHKMEDLFSAEEKERRSLNSSTVIDLLLRCTDLLSDIGKGATLQEGVDLSAMDRRVAELCDALEELSDTKSLDRRLTPVAAPAPASERASPPPAPPKPPRQQVQHTLTEAEVKVSASQLNQLLELTGEALVRARLLDRFAGSLYQLRGQLFELERLVDQLAERTSEEGASAKQSIRGIVAALEEQRTALLAFAAEQERLTDKTHQAAIASRMRPFSDVVLGYPRMVRDISRQLGKKTHFEIIGADVAVDREILAKIDAPLTHLLRNALDHGLEQTSERVAAGKPEAGQLRLVARHSAGVLQIVVADDGRGIEEASLRTTIVSRGLLDAKTAERLSSNELFEFLFLPGFSTKKAVTRLSGRGVGLDVVRETLGELGGKARVKSQPREGVEVTLQLPLTLSVIRALLVRIRGELYACRLASIERCLRVPWSDISVIENREFLEYEDRDIAVLDAAEVLHLPPDIDRGDGSLSVVLIGDGKRSFGLIVDCFVGERELVVRPLDDRLGQVECVAAASIIESGEPVLILSIESLIVAIDARLSGARAAVDEIVGGVEHDQVRLLVVDDSATVREQERDLLEGHGFKVDTAEDGMDGWSALTIGRYDLVITDIDMPRLNGLDLIRRMRSTERHGSVPVIVVSYRQQDRELAIAAGADRYFTKSKLHDMSIIEAVRELLDGGA